MWGLFYFDFIFFIFFFKYYSGAQCMSSKELLSSLQLMNIVMALGKKTQTIKKNHILLLILIATLFIIWQ